MKTIVYQSYRTTDVPPWIESCMRTVRSWAAARSHEYRFIDDRLFEYAPAWYREKAGRQICPITDLARLMVARELLAEGYDNAVWVDADMLVFAPENLHVNIDKDFAFCHEIWIQPDAAGRPICTHRVNNSIAVFARNNTHLEFFIDACLRIARHKPQLGKLDVGTQFLTQLRGVLPFPLISNVGMFSPAVMADIADGADRCLSNYVQHLTSPLACANLCGSLLGSQVAGIASDDRVYDAVVDRCLQTGGEVINRLFENRRQSTPGG